MMKSVYHKRPRHLGVAVIRNRCNFGVKLIDVLKTMVVPKVSITISLKINSVGAALQVRCVCEC